MATLTDVQYQGLLATLAEREKPGASRWLPEVYQALRGVARQYVSDAGPQSVMQPTALVHEAYLRLANKNESYWNGKTHFTAVAARAIRFVLINYLRDQHAQKRGGDARQFTLAGTLLGDHVEAVDIVALNDLIETLTKRSERQARIVEMRVFGGLTIEAAAEVLGVSPSTVKADWTIACAWLKAQL